MRLCGCSNWQRVVIAAECLIETFCDPQEDFLSWRPDLERVRDYTMLGEERVQKVIKVVIRNFRTTYNSYQP